MDRQKIYLEVRPESILMYDFFFYITSYSFGWLCMANISPSLWQDISFTSWRCHLTVAGWNIPILAATLFSFCSFCDDISDIGFQFPWDTGPGRILENDNLNHMQVGSGSTIVQSRAVGRSQNLRGAISNTRSFYGACFVSNSNKIWRGPLCPPGSAGPALPPKEHPTKNSWFNKCKQAFEGN